MASFGEAFKAARSAGKKTFKWQGKTYHTKTKDEMEKTKKSVPVPKPRPNTQTSSSTTKTSNSGRAEGMKAERSTLKIRDRQDYPRPAKAVGIAKSGSKLSEAAARLENAPRRNTDPSSDYWKSKDNPKQGPVPEGVWYARKGSSISVAAARRANRPVPRTKQ